MPSTPSSCPRPAPLAPAARRALAALCLATLLSSLGTSIANVGLPVLASHFGASFGAVQWVVLSYVVAGTATAALAGPLGDRYGRRRLLLGAIALFTAASSACALAPSLGVLVAARAVQGVGAALMFAVSLALLANAFPAPRERAGALAAYGATIGAAFAVGPAVGG